LSAFETVETETFNFLANCFKVTITVN